MEGVPAHGRGLELDGFQDDQKIWLVSSGSKLKDDVASNIDRSEVFRAGQGFSC